MHVFFCLFGLSSSQKKTGMRPCPPQGSREEGAENPGNGRS
jgi:hypothetical protein